MEALIPLDLDPRLVTELRAITTAALDRGVRRDVRLAVTGGSRRRYRLATRDVLDAESALVARIYRSPELLARVAAAAGEPVVPVPYQPEEFIATRLEEPGDVHGWHWDDYAYALVWVFRAPPPAAGGAVELVPGVPWDKSAPRVREHLRAGRLQRFHPAAGSAYLLRANATLHRVAPLRVPAVREMLCFSYANAADARRAITHETLEALTCA